MTTLRAEAQTSCPYLMPVAPQRPQRVLASTFFSCPKNLSSDTRLLINMPEERPSCHLLSQTSRMFPKITSKEFQRLPGKGVGAHYLFCASLPPFSSSTILPSSSTMWKGYSSTLFICKYFSSLYHDIPIYFTQCACTSSTSPTMKTFLQFISCMCFTIINLLQPIFPL